MADPAIHPKRDDEAASTASIARPTVPGEFRQFRIMSPLGAGGMGEVYRAHDTKLGRDVAIKILPPEFAGNPERLARFRQEARMLASLNHPNIAAIYSVEELATGDVLVLELVEGETLRGPLPIPAALDRAHQVAEALEAAHEKRIIHRDLKPANVKVTPHGRIKVLDFGLAKAVWGAEGSPDLVSTMTAGLESMAGRIVGTPGYMSPEQACGREVDQRTDTWAFGCLLYELLTGKRAFAGADIGETIAAVIKSEPDWQALPAKTPASIRALLKQCLQKDAALRLPHIARAREILEEAQKKRHRWVAAVAVASAIACAAGLAFWLRAPAKPADRSQWIQLTSLPDSASQPALSPDGRMLTFVRGPGTFISPGQIYVKRLPDGALVQLTNDSLAKMSPVFSPDGTQIAYTGRGGNAHWDTWTVPVSGGQAHLWLENASGLIWSKPKQILFSEIKGGIHMGLETAADTRAGERDIYVPSNDRGMVHRSWLSPDGKWVLLVEMDKDGLFIPCEVAAADGKSAPRSVGPVGAGCTFGAWSPDGKWVYLTSKAGGLNHIWRQRFPDGAPEQITSGPTQEEGIALASDGRSLVTAMALETGSVWVHDQRGDRQISLEGIAAFPRFTTDGQTLAYMVMKTAPWGGTVHDPGEVWVADLASGRARPVAPGFQAMNYDISPDGRLVVMESANRTGKQSLFLAQTAGGTPNAIPNAEGGTPQFGPDNEIFFRRAEEGSGFVYRIHTDGTGLRKALEQPVQILEEVSPDGRWIEALATLAGNAFAKGQIFPIGGGPAIALGPLAGWRWPRGGNFLAYAGGPLTTGHSYFLPLPPGDSVPHLPAGGFNSEEQLARLPGARRIDASNVVPGPSMDIYAYNRITTQRNLYRIPIP